MRLRSDNRGWSYRGKDSYYFLGQAMELFRLGAALANRITSSKTIYFH